MINPTLPVQAIKRLGRELADVLTGALDHADMPTGWEPESFDREARRLLAEFERRHGAPQVATRAGKDPA